MTTLLNEITNKLQNLINNTDVTNEKDIKRTTNYLNALSSHIDAVNREKGFSLSDEQSLLLKRGKVVWIDFGFNIGEEFGGKHPAIILRTLSNNQSLTVVPLDGKSDKPEVEEFRETHDYWVKVPRVFGMANVVRWVNVYRVKEVSTIRVDFKCSHGANVPVETLKDIDTYIEKYRYKSNYNKNHSEKTKFFLKTP